MVGKPGMNDVIVVGGGMVGGFCAYELARRGLKTLLLERGDIASGASGRGGGLLLKGATDVFTPEIVPHLLTNQHLLENFLEETRADVEYLRGGSVYVALEEDWNFTQSEVRRLNDAGVQAELWDLRELKRRVPTVTDRAVGARFIPSDAQCASPKLARAFAQAARRAGAEIKTGITVTSILENGRGSVCGVKTSAGQIYANWVILATNAYTPHLVPELEKVVIPTRGQALLTAPLPPSFPFACAAHYDWEYWRQTRSGQLLFGGCRRFERQHPDGKGTESTETTEEVLFALRGAFCSFFPTWEGVAVEKVWAGTMGFTPDYKPLIGFLPDRPNLLIGAGFSGNCLPFVCVTGQLLREIILEGKTSLLLAAFSPTRFLSSQLD
jgi:gamma-glutamylputrescine oxidase